VTRRKRKGAPSPLPAAPSPGEGEGLRSRRRSLGSAGHGSWVSTPMDLTALLREAEAGQMTQEELDRVLRSFLTRP